MSWMSNESGWLDDAAVGDAGPPPPATHQVRLGGPRSGPIGSEQLHQGKTEGAQAWQKASWRARSGTPIERGRVGACFAHQLRKNTSGGTAGAWSFSGYQICGVGRMATALPGTGDPPAEEGGQNGPVSRSRHGKPALTGGEARVYEEAALPSPFHPESLLAKRGNPDMARKVRGRYSWPLCGTADIGIRNRTLPKRIKVLLRPLRSDPLLESVHAHTFEGGPSRGNRAPAGRGRHRTQTGLPLLARTSVPPGRPPALPYEDHKRDSSFRGDQ